MVYKNSPLFQISTKKALSKLFFSHSEPRRKWFLFNAKNKTLEEKFIQATKKMKLKKINKIAYYTRHPQFSTIHQKMKLLLEDFYLANNDELKWLLSDVKGKGIFKLKTIHGTRLRMKDGIYFKLDIKNYYENTSIKKIIIFLQDKLQIAPDCVAILIKILTVKDEENKNFLPRGFAHSGLLALFANIDFFLEVNKFCEINNLSFSLYVDDMFFIGEDRETSEFAIREIIKIAKRHNIEINLDKTRLNSIQKGIKYHNLFLKNGVLKTNKNKINKKPNGYRKQIDRFNSSW